MEFDIDVEKNLAVIRTVIERLRAVTRGQIRGLEVDCDGEVLTICGEVDRSEMWRLVFQAAWAEARAAGGLLFDVRVKTATRS